MQKHNNRFKKGFTLIELMVVVSIIGILMASGIVAFSNAQSSARDSKRKADVQAMSKAMEQFNSNNGGVYPLPATASSSLNQFFPSNTIPKDPQTPTRNYNVSTSAPGDKYCVCADLEKNSGGNAGSLGANGLCSYAATGRFFCASQLQ